MRLGNAAGMQVSSASKGLEMQNALGKRSGNANFECQEATKRGPEEAQKAQGHQNEFRSTLEDKLLEKIVLIWTPAKTMKKTPQTSQEEEATK